MAIRRQTVALLVALAGVALLAALHHRPRVWVYKAGEVASPGQPAFYAPTPAQAARTLAQLKAPKGFSRTWAHCYVGEACFHHSPSTILTMTLVERWAVEAGLTVGPHQAAGNLLCHRPLFRARRTHLTLMGCGGVSATFGKLIFDAYANSIVFDGRHGIRATNARTHDDFQGTELHLIDVGLPSPETIRGEQAEVAKERG